MACTSGCLTQDHRSYSDCLRGKSIRIPQIPVEAISTQKKADKTLDAYAKARSFGIQPSSTRPSDINLAVRASDQLGSAFKA